MAGLIDRLDIYYPAGVDYFDATSEWYSRDDLRAMLRSDETREALAEAIYGALNDAAEPDHPHYPLDPETVAALAVVRVLTGEGER